MFLNPAQCSLTDISFLNGDQLIISIIFVQFVYALNEYLLHSQDERRCYIYVLSETSSFIYTQLDHRSSYAGVNLKPSRWHSVIGVNGILWGKERVFVNFQTRVLEERRKKIGRRARAIRKLTFVCFRLMTNFFLKYVCPHKCIGKYHSRRSRGIYRNRVYTPQRYIKKHFFFFSTNKDYSRHAFNYNTRL